MTLSSVFWPDDQIVDVANWSGGAHSASNPERSDGVTRYGLDSEKLVAGSFLPLREKCRELLLRFAQGFRF